MRDELMAEEIEIDPLWRTATFRAAERLTVEPSRCSDIVYGNREMERCGHGRLSSAECQVRRLMRRGSNFWKRCGIARFKRQRKAYCEG